MLSQRGTTQNIKLIYHGLKKQRHCPDYKKLRVTYIWSSLHAQYHRNTSTSNCRLSLYVNSSAAFLLAFSRSSEILADKSLIIPVSSWTSITSLSSGG